MSAPSEFPATELIYHLDAYCRQVSANVIAVDPELQGVVLDRTVLYGGGGGQPADTGLLRRVADGVEWRVTGSKRVGAARFHLLEEDAPLPVTGDAIECTVDWDNRYQLMRTHTALHVLCGVVFNDYGAKVTGGNMGLDKARMDFELEDLSAERVAQIQLRANEELGKELDVVVRVLSRDEAFAIPDLIRTKVNLLPEGITEVRTVHINGLDLQADGGTHVANTREIGGIAVVGTRSKGKSNKRLEIVVTDGMAAQKP